MVEREEQDRSLSHRGQGAGFDLLRTTSSVGEILDCRWRGGGEYIQVSGSSSVRYGQRLAGRLLEYHQSSEVLGYGVPDPAKGWGNT